MKSVVITGSTRGIGMGLAREFLRRGHQVIVSGRTRSASVAAAAILASEFDATRVMGVPCDVTKIDDVEALWREGVHRFGRVDVWINNAGISHAPVPFWEIEPGQIAAITQTNMVGLMNGCHVAMRGMIAQGGGVLFNMEGFGSNGMKRPGMSVYGSTKAALRYFTESLAREAKDTPVVIAAMSPGIVTTDLLLGGYAAHPAEWEKAKKFLAIAADRVETVAPFLVEHALGVTKSGARIEWLTTGRLMRRFASAPFVKRDVIPQGARAPEERTS